MKLLGLIGLLLLLATLLTPAGHRARQRAQAARQLRAHGAPVQVIRSPWAAHAPKSVRPVHGKG
ncbi:MAG: hypothetical protein ACRYFZ_28445 [Janthinobacterium lividum]